MLRQSLLEMSAVASSARYYGLSERLGGPRLLDLDRAQHLPCLLAVEMHDEPSLVRNGQFNASLGATRRPSARCIDVKS